ncbi:MAG: hypothetical protein JWN88_2223 [Frankiales bacterium]|jgi:hypothetical protein|nr:hypothetical protein [Frankiales bacterium]
MVERTDIPLPSDAGERMRAALSALKPPVPFSRSAAPVSSVFGRAAAAVPDDAHPAVGGEVVGQRIESLVTQLLLPGTALVLMVVPHRRAAAEAVGHGSRLVDRGAVVVVLGPDLPRAVTDRSKVLTVPLRADDSLSSEWGVIACGPTRRAALLAHEDRLGSGSWLWLSTRDSVAVHRAGTAVLERVPFLHLFITPLSDPAHPTGA